jgi:hypothetical protein
MTVLQMLSKMIGAEKLLSLIAFAEFMHVIQMFCSGLPIRGKWEFLTAITTYVGYARMGGRGVEGSMHTRKCSARPRMTPQVE